MQAAMQDVYGPPDVVELRDIERPTPAEDRVLVRVHAASVNRADLDGLGPRPGFVRLFRGLRAPRSPRIGLDVAGEVEAVGPSATRFRPGDRVFADLYAYGGGSFAEYVCAPEKAFLAIPDAMSFEDAATLPHSGVLAMQGLRLRGGRTPGPGDKVLIDGASGNVGPFAVQVAKAFGAEVTGACRTEKVEFVRALGADHVIDYTEVDYTQGGTRYDWILDTDSHHPIFRIRRALRKRGVYLTLGGSSLGIVSALAIGPLITLAGERQMGIPLWWRPFDAGDVSKLCELIAAGKVRPVIDRRYPLGEIVEALRWVHDGRAKGKVIITF
jgi:NADPH:quinone reductase-like Zn-dependent oxidoreductase